MERNRESAQKQMEELKKQYKHDANDETIALDYAEKLFQLGNFAQSKEILHPLITKNNTIPRALYLSARIEYVSGNYSKAEELYKTLINHFPEYEERAERGLGYVYYQTNQFSKAQGLSVAYDSSDAICVMMRAFGDSTT